MMELIFFGIKVTGATIFICVAFYVGILLLAGTVSLFTDEYEEKGLEKENKEVHGYDTIRSVSSKYHMSSETKSTVVTFGIIILLAIFSHQTNVKIRHKFNLLLPPLFLQLIMISSLLRKRSKKKVYGTMMKVTGEVQAAIGFIVLLIKTGFLMKVRTLITVKPTRTMLISLQATRTRT
jgi:hypothetical protein